VDSDANVVVWESRLRGVVRVGYADEANAWRDGCDTVEGVASER
jgi:hypothetical protein